VKPAEEACDGGLLVSLAIGKKPCIKPGSGQSFRDCADCPEMAVAPAGSFTMGSPADEPERYANEGPQHNVRLPRPFAVGRFAVTRDEFEAFVKDTSHKTEGGCYVSRGSEWKQDSALSWRSPGFEQTGSHPVVCVNWNDAKSYTAWLSKKTGKSYRLLSEAEREYVARAGTATPFWWGKAITSEQANYNGHLAYAGGKYGEDRGKTVPVNSFKPNHWGCTRFMEMFGNGWRIALERITMAHSTTVRQEQLEIAHIASFAAARGSATQGPSARRTATISTARTVTNATGSGLPGRSINSNGKAPQCRKRLHRSAQDRRISAGPSASRWRAQSSVFHALRFSPGKWGGSKSQEFKAVATAWFPTRP
jgi:Sulfatase-modifying factor enzyme 1